MSNNKVGLSNNQNKTSQSQTKLKENPGPYIAIIKNNADPTRSGRLQVFIPDLGGVEDDSSQWRTVQYISPFFGTTTQKQGPKPSKSNNWKKTPHTYGMWMTPPDIGNYVLVTFAMGDPNKGFWLGCINNALGQSMVPGISRTSALDRSELSPDLAANLTGKEYPTTEFNEVADAQWGERNNFLQIPRPIHEAQARVLLEQGLQDDLVRGVVTSSSQRESPSAVFGISTPGRDSGNLKDLDPTTKSPTYRLGGHQFVMDDGDAIGNDKMIRLRTSGGHQIMLNDSEQIMYFANSTGTVWMEFTEDGKFHVFTKGEFNLRAERNVNIHTDIDVNLHTGRDINFYAVGDFNFQAENINFRGRKSVWGFGGKIDIHSGSTYKMSSATETSINGGVEIKLSASKTIGVQGGGSLVASGGKIYLNTQAAPQAPVVEEVKDMPLTDFPDVVKEGLRWKVKEKKIKSISKIVPHHEPWITEHKKNQTQTVPEGPGSPATTTATGQQAAKASEDPVSSMPGPKAAEGKGVVGVCTPGELATQPPTTANIDDKLSTTSVDALKAQAAKATGGDYGSILPTGELGKYAADAKTLIDQGMVKAGTLTSELSDAAKWIGQNGIDSAEKFLASTHIQEMVMDNKLTSMAKDLASAGLNTIKTTAGNLGGMLNLANGIGVQDAIKWVKTGIDTAAGTAINLFNQGRYAVDVLAKQGAALMANAIPAANRVIGGVVTPIVKTANSTIQDVTSKITKITKT